MTQALVHLPVSDCMTPLLITVNPYDPLSLAYELMMSHHIRRLPVVQHTKLVGIITLSDLLDVKQSDPAQRLSLEEVARSLAKLTVGTIMKKDPVCVHGHDTLGHAAELMLENKIGGLPVIDDEHQLAGIITESNIFGVLAKQWRADNLIFSGARLAPL